MTKGLYRGCLIFNLQTTGTYMRQFVLLPGLCEKPINHLPFNRSLLAQSALYHIKKTVISGER
jgi:hypothetical protein